MLPAPSVLDEVNGLCNLHKQVSGGHRVTLGNVISQGSSVSLQQGWIFHKNLFLNYMDGLLVFIHLSGWLKN